MKYRYLFILFLLFSQVHLNAQLQNLSGKISANSDVEGIHILNKSSVKYTVSRGDGTFDIAVKVNDTLVFSALKYQLKEVVITQKILRENFLKIHLTEKVNELDEVLVGKILTGNLGSDIKNTKVETPINFYDLGISGYTGKQKTANERKLAAATSGPGIPLVGLINAITGRTKILKANVQLDKDIKCINNFKDEYKNLLFEDEECSDEVKERFFDFVMFGENFRTICKEKNPLNVIAFLQKELKILKDSTSVNDKKN